MKTLKTMNIGPTATASNTITGSQGGQNQGGRAANLFQLLVSNLEPSVSLSEWRRILIAHFQALTTNNFQVSVQRQAEGGCCAIVKVATLDDAQLAIVQLNRRKIGYRRIRVSMLNANDAGERHKRKMMMPMQGSNGPMSQQRPYHRGMKFRDGGEQRQHYGRRNDRNIMLAVNKPVQPLLNQPEVSLQGLHHPNRGLLTCVFFPDPAKPRRSPLPKTPPHGPA